MDIARKLGADIVINPLEHDPVSAIRDATRRGEGADKSLECSGHADARRQSIEALRRWGMACMVGVNGKIEFDVNDIIQHQKTVTGSVTFSKNLLDDCAHYVAERGIDVETLFTHSFRIEEAKEAYDLFDAQKMGKGVFLFD